MTTVKLNDFEMNFIWVALKARESEYLMKSGKRDENMKMIKNQVSTFPANIGIFSIHAEMYG